jgi:hypothetical protein
MVIDFPFFEAAPFLPVRLMVRQGMVDGIGSGVGSPRESRDKMAALIAENQELCWILAASVRTAGGSGRPI